MTKEVGMLDVGTHCAFCRELDFLPFYCTGCNQYFCAKHRLKEDHHCISLQQHAPVSEHKRVKADAESPRRKGGSSLFQSLLPAKAHDRVKAALEHERQVLQQQASTTMKSQLFSSSTSGNAGSLRAVDKLQRFFAKHGKFFESKKQSTKLSSANKLIQVTKMKRTALGDPSIPVANRVYVWCYVVADSPQKPKSNEVFINKMWPVGRALDSLASLLSVKNQNIDHTASQDEKLFLYKGDATTHHLLQSANRVSSSIKEGDTLYLVRGLALS